MIQKKKNFLGDIIIARARLKHWSVILLGVVGVLVCSTGLIFGVQRSSETVTAERIRSQRVSEQKGIERYRMNRQLVRLGAQGVERDLIESLLRDPDSMVRQGAAQKLGNYAQNPVVVKALGDQLNVETESAVRYACVQSLSLSSSYRAMSTLEKFSDDSDPVMRRLVAFNLKRREETRAKLILKKMRRDKDASVRALAQEERP